MNNTLMSKTDNFCDFCGLNFNAFNPNLIQLIIIYGEIFLPKFFVLGKTQFGEKKLNHQRKTEKNLIQFFASK